MSTRSPANHRRDLRRFEVFEQNSSLAQIYQSSEDIRFYQSSYFRPPCTHLYLVITQSWTDVYGHPVRFQLVSALDLPHEFRGRSDRECQDLRLGRLGVPRPARIAARLTLCPRDLPGLRIRLTTVPCILPERLELTWCHRGPAGGSG
ncbi:F-box family protein with DUF295 [Prunus dulcis]|uniref:F-box family protein with DUF295 n=1 Tax=Prunus dulcis TaxID=3755 RepID=A0A5H2Y6N8_PRUDU|nr:F-box family protein with DUF295 [Prunus dulcis]